MYNGYVPYYTPHISGKVLGTFKKFNWGSFLNNTQKTLSVINQAIPLVYQVKPIFNNVKTVFRIIGAVKDDNPSTTSNSNTVNNTTKINPSNNNQPNFFL